VSNQAQTPRPQLDAGTDGVTPKGRRATKRASTATAIAAIIAAVFAVEGGYVDDPVDRGGPTNHGITERVARQHGYTGHMAHLPQLRAYQIYEADYIRKPGYIPLVEIDPVVAEEVIDTAVNMGPGRASNFFQRAVNSTCGTSLTVDGRVGPATVAAWRDCRAKQGDLACVVMLDRLDALQAARYDAIIRANPSQRRFRKGWFNHRINNVERDRCATKNPLPVATRSIGQNNA
jgi:lysozyme family protein